MNYLNKILIILLSVLPLLIFSQEKLKHARKGNKLYNKEMYKEAEISYLKALETDPTYAQGLFNLGDAYYKQENFEEAIKVFQGIASYSNDKKTVAKAYHNLGNSYLQSKKIKESIEAYKNSLKLNPYDQETKYNLAYAKSMMQKQEQQKCDNPNKDNKDQDKEENKENQDKENQENQKEKDKQDKKEQKEKEGQEEKEKQEEEQKKQEQQKQQAKKEQQLTKKDAERMLEAMKQEEKRILEKRKKEQKVKGRRIEKDW